MTTETVTLFFAMLAVAAQLAVASLGYVALGRQSSDGGKSGASTPEHA